jgi:pimeloyl-ACP methyl ester carboxylesterase
MAVPQAKGSYAQVNGLKMYYESHGDGTPLLLLQGAFGTAESWSTVLPTLSKSHQVIVVELQGHGRTGDIDRPLSHIAPWGTHRQWRLHRPIRTHLVGGR